MRLQAGILLVSTWLGTAAAVSAQCGAPIDLQGQPWGPAEVLAPPGLKALEALSASQGRHGALGFIPSGLQLRLREDVHFRAGLTMADAPLEDESLFFHGSTPHLLQTQASLALAYSSPDAWTFSIGWHQGIKTEVDGFRYLDNTFTETVTRADQASRGVWLGMSLSF